MEFRDFKLVVVGAGFFGATIAWQAATGLGLPVLVVERRRHIGGNAWSEVDPATGIEFHRYGSHLFHTSNERVWNFVRRFSEFNNYRHRVFIRHHNHIYTMPINLLTIRNFFGLDLTPREAEQLIAHQAAKEGIATPTSLEEKAVSMIGRPLYEALVKGYTAKQWQTDPRTLPPEIIARLPVRFGFNDFYFSDRYEGLPIKGYGAIFQQLLTHPKIALATDCDFFDIRGRIDPTALVVYTGPVDRYFDYRFGALGWRTLDFEIERLDVEDFQGAPVVNYADAEVPFTRIHEFKHLHPERQHKGRTLIMREYARFAGRTDEPYYPIGRHEDKIRYERYGLLAEGCANVVFGGRLGTYRYLDMHQAIASALLCYDRRVAPQLTGEKLAAATAP